MVLIVVDDGHAEIKKMARDGRQKALAGRRSPANAMRVLSFGLELQQPAVARAFADFVPTVFLKGPAKRGVAVRMVRSRWRAGRPTIAGDEPRDGDAPRREPRGQFAEATFPDG